MVKEPGALRRTAMASASGTGSSVNVPPGASDAGPCAGSRPPLRAIQPAALRAKREPGWPAPVPSKPPLISTKKSLGVKAGKRPARVATSLPGPTKRATALPLRLGSSTARVNSSAEMPRFKFGDDPSFWDENHNAQLERMSQELEKSRYDLQVCLESNKELRREIADLRKELSDITIRKREEYSNVPENVPSTLQQHDCDSREKMEDCSDEVLMRNSEYILKLQLELDILKTVLAEEGRAMEKKLNNARSIVEYLEAELLMLINKADEPKKTKYQIPELLEVMKENESLSSVIVAKEIVGKEQRMVELLAKIEANKLLVTIEDHLQLFTNHVQNYMREHIDLVSKFSFELDIIQVSAEELINHNSLLQSELRRRDEIAKGLSFDHKLLEELASVAKVQAESITYLEQELASKSLELDDVICDSQQLEAQVLKINAKVAALEEENHELKQLKQLEGISCAMEKELARKTKCTATLEEELIEPRSLLDERNVFVEKLQNDLPKLSDGSHCCDTQVLIFNERMDKAQAYTKETEFVARVTWQVLIAYLVAYDEEKNEKAKLLERSIEDLEITVHTYEEQVKQQTMQQEELEVELQNVRQQMLAVPSYRNARSSLEDAFDSADSNRHLRDVHNELLGAQENARKHWKEVSEKESKDFRPLQEGHMRSTISLESSMGMTPPFEELMEGSYARDADLCANACSSGDIFKDDTDVSLSDSHALAHITSQRKPDTYPVVEAGESPLVENWEETVEELEESSVDEDMQSDHGMAETHSSDEDYQPESSQFEHSSASEQLEMSSGLCDNGAGSEEQQKPVVEVVEENELPPLAPFQPSRVPLNLSKNHYEGQRTATDRRFWSIEQQDLYTSIYRLARVVDSKWIDWEHIDSVRQRCADLGLEEIMSYCCDWDNELIRQFYATVQISDDKTSMTWMADGRRITTNKRAWEERFGIPSSDHTEIHSQLYLDDDDKRILYAAAEYTLGRTSGLSPLASIAHKILKMTIYPRFGNQTHHWNVLHHIVEQRSFDIISLIFNEIDLLIRNRSRTKHLFYAPYIMGMIMAAFEYDGPRESRHQSYKPRNYKRKQSKKVGRRAATVVAPPVAAAPLDPPSSAFQPKVAAVGHDAHVEAVDHNCQFEAAGRQATVQPITRTVLIQVVEDELRPIRDKLASMEGRIGSSDNMIGSVEATPAPSLQATTSPALNLAPEGDSS
ncbi:hypothetical protein ACP70R_033377 [Stipagrostis hirtigluma subsp. patula]